MYKNSSGRTVDGRTILKGIICEGTYEPG